MSSSDSNLTPTSSKKKRSEPTSNTNNIGLDNLECFELMQDEKENLKDLALDEIFKLASKGEFPKKLFLFNDCKKSYSERLHFWTSSRVFNYSVKDVKKIILSLSAGFVLKK